jgi:hypothetical protein
VAAGSAVVVADAATPAETSPDASAGHCILLTFFNFFVVDGWSQMARRLGGSCDFPRQI